MRSRTHPSGGLDVDSPVPVEEDGADDSAGQARAWSARPREHGRLDHLADRVAQVQACFLYPSGVMRLGTRIRFWATSAAFPPRAPVSATVVISRLACRFERADDVERVARCAEADHDISRAARSEYLAGKYLVIGVIVADRRHRGRGVRKTDRSETRTVESEAAHELGSQMPGVLGRPPVAEEDHLSARAQGMLIITRATSTACAAKGPASICCLTAIASDSRACASSVLGGTTSGPAHADHVVNPLLSNANSVTLAPANSSASMSRCFLVKSQNSRM